MFNTNLIVDKARVVFPEDSGPKISMILPLGKPPVPNASSRARDPRM